MPLNVLARSANLGGIKYRRIKTKRGRDILGVVGETDWAPDKRGELVDEVLG